MSGPAGASHRIARADGDRWAPGRALLRAADPRMAELVKAEPGLEQVDALGEPFRPWRTLAAAYLYSSVEP